MNNRATSPYSRIVFRLLLSFLPLIIFVGEAEAQSLGAAQTFAVLGASTVTNGGLTQISGDLGVGPGTAITGFPPGVITNGSLHPGDAVATQAHADLATAYAAFAALPYLPANDLSGQDLGGKTLLPGVYHYATSAGLTGILTLDAQNDPNARFVIQIGTTLITSSISSVQLINSADVQNVFFQVAPPPLCPVAVISLETSSQIAPSLR